MATTAKNRDMGAAERERRYVTLSLLTLCFTVDQRQNIEKLVADNSDMEHDKLIALANEAVLKFKRANELKAA